MEIHNLYMGQFPHDGENGQNVAFLYFLELCCDQTVLCFQLSWTVLKRFWPGHSKNVFLLVLAHLESDRLKLMTLAMMVMMICSTIISQTSNNSSSGSRWARTKTKTFFECPGQNIFRTVEKSWKNQTVWVFQFFSIFKKTYARSILKMFSFWS